MRRFGTRPGPYTKQYSLNGDADPSDAQSSPTSSQRHVVPCRGIKNHGVTTPGGGKRPFSTMTSVLRPNSKVRHFSGSARSHNYQTRRNGTSAVSDAQRAIHRLMVEHYRISEHRSKLEVIATLPIEPYASVFRDLIFNLREVENDVHDIIQCFKEAKQCWVQRNESTVNETDHSVSLNPNGSEWTRI